MISIASIHTQFVAFWTRPLWMHEIFNNTLGDYAFALFWCVILWGVLLLIHWSIGKAVIFFVRHAKNQTDEALSDIVHTVNKWFYAFLALYSATYTLNLSETVVFWFKALLIAWTGYQVALAVIVIIDHVLGKFFDKNVLAGEPEEEGSESARVFVSSIMRGVVWIVAVLCVLALLGVNVGSFATGLGVGGIVLAFALQNVLTDLFSSFVIHAEKPFKPGDFIVVGEHRGTVKTIGIKTTRIQALQGEEVVISNQEMTSARVQNFKKMEERRVLFNLGIEYGTSLVQMKKIPDVVKNIIEKQNNVRFDRAHFKGFGDSSLDVEVVYFVLTNDYGEYMNVQQAINFGIMEAFEREAIAFAFPSQTLYIKQ